MNKRKLIILASIIIGVLVVTLGLTYAVLSFNETKGNSQLVLGDIYMHYGETNQINLQNAIPTESYLPNGYFEFTIDGKNTYTKKDIWYEIVLNHGDEHETRQTRIRDDLLKFRLVEVNNNVETELFTNKSYSSLTNKRIWVDTISKNTTSEITKTYRLYMWISNDTKVGNTSDSDYDNETWNDDVYGSIKVSVRGDFNKKELAYEDIYNVTDASCFTYEGAGPATPNPNMTDEELATCVSLIRDKFQGEPPEGEDFESFCNGTGTLGGEKFVEVLSFGVFSEDELITLVQNNIVTIDVIITDYDASCGSDVVIPKEIDGLPVTTLSKFDYSADTAAFRGKNLTSVVIPNTVVSINQKTFINNNISSVTFESGSQLKDIQRYAFYNNLISQVDIPNSIEYLSCVAFDKNVSINTRDDLICTNDEPN